MLAKQMESLLWMNSDEISSGNITFIIMFFLIAMICEAISKNIINIIINFEANLLQENKVKEKFFKLYTVQL